MRIMGLDYGSRTVGVAVSDPLGITAQAVETICRKDENKLRKTCARIEELVAEYEVEKIVLGLPKHMNNDIGDRAEKSMQFGEMIGRRTGLEVVMWDERLTTVSAERTLIENKVRREDRKKYIDQIAAVFILQGYLDSAHLNKEGRRFMEKITFASADSRENEEFFVLEQTKLNGVSYILVTDSEEDDAECWILKDTSPEESSEAIYEFVEDEKELNGIMGSF